MRGWNKRMRRVLLVHLGFGFRGAASSVAGTQSNTVCGVPFIRGLVCGWVQVLGLDASLESAGVYMWCSHTLDKWKVHVASPFTVASWLISVPLCESPSQCAQGTQAAQSALKAPWVPQASGTLRGTGTGHPLCILGAQLRVGTAGAHWTPAQQPVRWSRKWMRNKFGSWAAQSQPGSSPSQIFNSLLGSLDTLIFFQ